MLKKSLRLFQLWGIPVELHVSWLLILVLITWSFATGFYPANYPGLFSSLQIWAMSLLTAVLLFISILLHEFSHSLVAKRNGLPIGKITLFMFGGVAQMKNEVESPGVELRMASAGPVMTLVLVGVFYLLSRLLYGVTWLSVLFQALSSINAVVFIFNMVPGFPLDGGRILRALIWYKNGNILKATRFASMIGKGFALLLMAFGVFSVLVYSNFIGGIWLVIIGGFLRQAANRSYKIVLYRQVLEEMDLEDIVRRDVVTVNPSMNLEALVNEYFRRYQYFSFPVVENGFLIGLVSIDDVKKVKKTSWADTIVARVVNTRLREFVIHGFNSPGRLFQLINSNKYDNFPVVDSTGTLRGIINRSDFEKAVKVTLSLSR